MGEASGGDLLGRGARPGWASSQVWTVAACCGRRRGVSPRKRARRGRQAWRWASVQEPCTACASVARLTCATRHRLSGRAGSAGSAARTAAATRSASAQATSSARTVASAAARVRARMACARSSCLSRLNSSSTCQRARYSRTMSAGGQVASASVVSSSHQPASHSVRALSGAPSAWRGAVSRGAPGGAGPAAAGWR